MTNIDDLLDERMTGGSDYPDFWEPEDEGDTLEGIVTNRQDNPWAPADEEDPKQMLYVATENGEYSTRTHTVLSNLIKDQGVEEGDYVRIEYTGEHTTDRGQTAKDYMIGVVKESELEDSDIEIPETDGGVAVATPTDSGPSGVPDEAVEFVENLMEYHGNMDVDEVDRYVNDVRDFGLTVEEVVAETEYQVKNGVIR